MALRPPFHRLVRLIQATDQPAEGEVPPEDNQKTYKHPGGEPKSKGPLKAGMRHGAWTILNANGSKDSEGEYRWGVRHGFWTSYYPSGQKASEREYYRGILKSGTYWNEEGEEISEDDYNAKWPEESWE